MFGHQPVGATFQGQAKRRQELANTFELSVGEPTGHIGAQGYDHALFGLCRINRIRAVLRKEHPLCSKVICGTALSEFIEDWEVQSRFGIRQVLPYLVDVVVHQMVNRAFQEFLWGICCALKINAFAFAIAVPPKRHGADLGMVGTHGDVDAL